MTMTVPGFEAVFAIIGLLIVAWLVRKNRDREDEKKEDEDKKLKKRGHR